MVVAILDGPQPEGVTLPGLLEPFPLNLYGKARPGIAMGEGLILFFFRRHGGWNRIGFGHPAA